MFLLENFLVVLIYAMFLIYGIIVVVTCFKNYKNKSLYQKTKQISAVFSAMLAVLVLLSISFGLGNYASFNLARVWTCAIGVLFLSQLFQNIKTIADSPTSKLFYFIGLLLVTLASFEIHDLHDDVVFWYFIGLLVVMSFILVGTVFTWLFVKVYDTLKDRKTTNKDQDKFSPGEELSPQMADHYKKHGIQGDQLKYFREEMRSARGLILSLEEKLPYTARLRAIESRHNTIKICQSFFQHVVANPSRLVDASQFLHNLLPSLEDIVSKYNEINGHVAKNKQTYLILDKSAQMVEKLCEEISDEYINFHKQDLQDLEDELKLAKKSIDKNDESDLTKDELIDQLINSTKKGGDHG